MTRILLILLLSVGACRRPVPERRDAPPVPDQAPETGLAQTPVPPPPEPRPVNPRLKENQFSVDGTHVDLVRLPAGDGAVQFVLAGRFDRGQSRLLAYVYADRIAFRTMDGTPVASAVHAGFPRLARLVPGGGGRPDRVLVGWGRNPAEKTPAELVSFTLTDASALGAGKKPEAVHEVVFEARSSRADPQDAVVAADGSLYLAWFSDKYTVRVGVRAAGVHEVKELVAASMIGRLAVAPRAGGGQQVFVARVYGDEPGSDGGLFRLEDGKLSPLPSVRGVRGLWAASTRDGFEVWAGDGWDKDYGKVARALVSVVTLRGQTVERRQVAEVAAGYTVLAILPCNLQGPGNPGFLLKTNNQLLWIDASGGSAPAGASTPAPAPLTLAQWGGPADPVVADVDGDGLDEILIGSPEPALLRARKK